MIVAFFFLEILVGNKKGKKKDSTNFCNFKHIKIEETHFVFNA